MLIRVADKDGQPWFLAKDVCAELGLGNVSMAVEKLDQDERGSISLADRTPAGGNPNVLVVSESGLYALVLRCRDAIRRPFRHSLR
jgi:prophage antirepressor-like protein